MRSLLKTPKWLCILLRIKAKVLTTAYKCLYWLALPPAPFSALIANYSLMSSSAPDTLVSLTASWTHRACLWGTYSSHSTDCSFPRCSNDSCTHPFILFFRSLLKYHFPRSTLLHHPIYNNTPPPAFPMPLTKGFPFPPAAFTPIWFTIYLFIPLEM